MNEIEDFFRADPEKAVTLPNPEVEAKEIPAVINEQLLGEYLNVCKTLVNLEDVKVALRKQIIKLTRGNIGNTRHGKYTLLVKPRKTVSVDWTKYVEDQMGAAALAEIESLKELVKENKITSPYVNRKDSTVIDVVETEE